MDAPPTSPRPAAGPADAALAAALDRLATTGRLLVAVDYDGTLAPIVDDPLRAVPQPGAPAALRALAATPGTSVALVSGRERAVLARLSGMTDPIRLVGSHGSEFDDDLAASLGPDRRALLARVTAELREIAADSPGALVETKPASSTLHVRRCPDPDHALDLLDRARRGPATRPGVAVTEGKMVIELAVITTGKGAAIRRLAAETTPSADASASLAPDATRPAVLFLGDDVTDEDGFAALDPHHDLGIRVGPTPAGHTSRAAFEIPDPAAVVAVLVDLHRRRTGSKPTPE